VARALSSARGVGFPLASALGLLLSVLFVSHAAAFKGFEAPSGNIGCVMTEQGARCDIRDHTWPVPKTPKSCEFDYGAIFVDVKGKGHFDCVSDSAFGAGPVLPYGESIRKARFLCTSEEIGVRCRNLRNGHGFLVSRQRVRFF
jgi:hypothetical protein